MQIREFFWQQNLKAQAPIVRNSFPSQFCPRLYIDGASLSNTQTEQDSSESLESHIAE